jgi:hypothetical protein
LVKGSKVRASDVTYASLHQALSCGDMSRAAAAARISDFREPADLPSVSITHDGVRCVGEPPREFHTLFRSQE